MNIEALTQTGQHLMRTAFCAGVEIMRIYSDKIEVEHKADDSPVTKADKLAEQIILSRLKKEFPAIPVISEEAASIGDIPDIGAQFFLVDPLDGTREFVKKNDEFTVNIALINQGKPVIGLVYAPALKKAFYGEREQGAFMVEFESHEAFTPHKVIFIKARPAPKTGLTMVGSRSHKNPEQTAFIEKHNVREEKPMGSSIKFCVIAEGLADVYPRFGRTMEWDTAAGQAVLEAAGGSVLELDETSPLEYGKEKKGYENPGFVAFGMR